MACSVHKFFAASLPLFLFIFLSATLPSHAQTAMLASAASALPNAPDPAGTAHSGVISGTVVDPTGEPIANAEVNVRGQSLPAPMSTKTDTQGKFTIGGLGSGDYTVTVFATHFLNTTAPTVALGDGEVYRLSITATPIPQSSTTVEVTASEQEIATAQLHLEEKQRILGFVPNFYTSYVWDAAPLDAKQKMALSFHSLLDPFTPFEAAAAAGAEQVAGLQSGYGSGAEGYGKRYGAAYADIFVSRIIGDGLLPSVFRQDPRYFYRGTGSVGSRMWYAARSAFVARGDNGKWEPNYSGLLGDFTSAGISNAYSSPSDRGLGTTLQNGAILVAGDAFEDELLEFLSRKLTHHIPPGAHGK
ncbi:MAG TPA: carboxypeptidase regulatory-like domain-containing protein [Acidobacterium sp.]|nr:carboxypeptidase regulatory-like domain-containing protein [Acidobacterium sp.]